MIFWMLKLDRWASFPTLTDSERGLSFIWILITHSNCVTFCFPFASHFWDHGTDCRGFLLSLLYWLRPKLSRVLIHDKKKKTTFNVKYLMIWRRAWPLNVVISSFWAVKSLLMRNTQEKMQPQDWITFVRAPLICETFSDFRRKIIEKFFVPLNCFIRHTIDVWLARDFDFKVSFFALDEEFRAYRDNKKKIITTTDNGNRYQSFFFVLGNWHFWELLHFIKQGRV